MLYLCITLAFLASCSEAALVRDPPKDAVMISEHSKGIKLACYFNHTDENEQDQDEDEDLDDKSVISWEHEGDSAVTIKDEWITIDDNGRSILHIPHEEAKEGRITCDSGSEEHSWSVTPLFRLEAMPKSQYVSEEDDFYLKCVLDEGSMSSEEGQLTFQWTRHEENDRTNFTELPTNEETPHKEKHFQIIQPDGADNSTLKIENVIKNDRAVYRCVATLIRKDSGDEVKSTTETLIRVKDKYSALYPFIGIVAEVVVLVVVIFICERRKSSGDADDDDDDKGPVGGSGAGAGPSNGSSANVRHRRT